MSEHWISPTGDDEDPGTLAEPWRTPNKALSWLNSSGSPGDVIWARGGTTLDKNVQSVLTKSGLSGNPILIQNWQSEVPIWDGTNSPVTGYFGQWEIDADFIDMTGIRFTNAPRMGLEFNGSDCNFTRLVSYGHGLSGYYTYSGHNNYFSKDIAYDNYSYVPGDADGWGFAGASAQFNTIDQCEIYACGDDGIDFWRSQNNTIKRSVVYNMNRAGEGNGIKLGDEYADPATQNNRAEQCLVWDCKAAGCTSNGGGGLWFVNNTVYDCVYGFSNNDNPGDAREGTNKYYNNGAYGNTNNYGAWGSSPTQDKNSWNLDPPSPNPLWIGTDDSNWDTFLAIPVNSPWKDAGGSYGIFDDIGALEYGTTLNEMMERGGSEPDYTHPPHNHFEDDPDCMGWFRMENGALTADSRGGNTLTNDGVTVNTVNYMEGSAAGEFDLASNLRIADDDLDEDFPLKSGDTTKTFTFMGYFDPDVLDAYQGLVAKYEYIGNSKRSFAAIVREVAKMRFAFGYNGGASYEGVDHDGVLTQGHHYFWGCNYEGDGTRGYFIHVYDVTADSQLGSDIDDALSNNLYVGDADFTIGGLEDGGYEFDGTQDGILAFKAVRDKVAMTKVRNKVYGCFEGRVGKVSNPHKIGQVVGLNIESYNGVDQAT